MSIDNQLVVEKVVESLISSGMTLYDDREELIEIVDTALKNWYLTIINNFDVESALEELVNNDKEVLEKCTQNSDIFGKYFNIDLPGGVPIVKVFYVTPFISVLYFFLDKFYDNDIGDDFLIQTSLRATIDHCLAFPDLTQSPLLQE